MANLKTQFSEFRKSTPKYVQWLLMAAAFIVVLILLTLLLRGDKKQDVNAPTAVQPVLHVTPESLEWANSTTGSTYTERVTVTSNVPVKIDDVRLSKEIAGLSKRDTCKNIGQISDKISCTITAEYKPVAEQDITAISLFIDWRGANQPENMKRTEKIIIAVGATDPVIAKPEVIEEPEPAPVYVPAQREEIKHEIEVIAPPVRFIEENTRPVREEPVYEPIREIEEEIIEELVSESCSDFAFPGYNSSGQQIGWIKPHGGSYRFHPFTDKNCNNPTGIYNPDNGIITDINNPSRKIGTDAEHIGYGTISNGVIPALSNPATTRNVNRARELSSDELMNVTYGGARTVFSKPPTEKIMTSSGDTIVSSAPYDRTFILRQYKPIPATIVSEIRADQALVNGEYKLPVIATVDRNVYSDNGRTIIVPTGTTLYGYVTGDVPGPYKSIGRMQVKWYQFVRPDGVEFNFGGNDPFSGDAQGRIGVPGRGSTDYIEQFLMPMLTAVVPAAVNMIAPISDRFINQIDLDNNTVTQTGTVRSSELAKQEIVTAWNNVANKLLVDMMDNTVPPFSIAAGTRINVFSPVDLQVTCGLGGDKKCAISEYGPNKRQNPGHNVTMAAPGGENEGSMIGQVRSFNFDQYCSNGKVTVDAQTIAAAGYDYRTVEFYCQSNQYQAINNAKQDAVFNNQVQTGYASSNMGTTTTSKSGSGNTFIGNQQYNEQVLGLKYNDEGKIQNPFEKAPAPAANVLTCEDGTLPDANGCCTGETYTDMGEQGFNCCPEGGGDCFPPIL